MEHKNQSNKKNCLEKPAQNERRLNKGEPKTTKVKEKIAISNLQNKQASSASEN